jgi:hypothetical protein
MTTDLFNQIKQEPMVRTNKGIIHLSGFTADKIKGLLEKHHERDIFFTEVKNGPTWSSSHLLKMDAWALPKTYAPLHTVGYEIKVSRSDFEQDQKWVEYLPLCHRFFFVCPGGLIRSHELPQEAGLIWVSSTGRLITKKAAQHREPDLKQLNALLIYVLMCRTELKEQVPYDNIQAKRKAVDDAEARQELAYFVKSHIRKTIEIYNDKNRELSSRESDVKRFASALSRLGINWNPDTRDWQDSQRVENEINILKGQIDRFTLRNMKDVAERLLRVVQDIEKMNFQ